MMQAAYELGADPALTIMAFTWGDGWTNQIHPFWALPHHGLPLPDPSVLWSPPFSFGYMPPLRPGISRVFFS